MNNSLQSCGAQKSAMRLRTIAMQLVLCALAETVLKVINKDGVSH